MAVGPASAPPHRFRDLLDALFGEAWRLQRRRRRRWALLAAITCAAAAIAVLMLGSGGGGPPGGAGSVTLARASVVARALPALGQNPTLGAAGGRLIVSNTDPMNVVDGRVLGTCSAASVDPETLRLVSLARGNCGDPALYGRHILAVIYQVNRSPGRGWGTDELGIRIATVDRGAPGAYALGPLIVGYPDCSDCRAQMIESSNALWVYAPITSPGASGELLRISDATGRVTHRWAIPHILRALLATDADGLWFAPGVESCCVGPRSSWARQGRLYHVAPGSRAPTPVLDVGGHGASWLVASGHTVWLQAQSHTGQAPLWRIDHSRTHRVLSRAGASDECGDVGEGSPIVLGSGAIGIYCVTSGVADQGVIRINPERGASTTVTTVRTEQEYAMPDSAVVLDGSYYFLDPPNTIASGQSSPVLYRIRPH
ncbi:MAG: hypothetical protein ACRDMJ_04435 [Solirubrobacteraceae bacterium]